MSGIVSVGKDLKDITYIVCNKTLRSSISFSLLDHIVPEHVWTENPEDCFQTCHHCSILPPTTLQRSNSRSTGDIHEQRPYCGGEEEEEFGGYGPPSQADSTHRRTHSLPEKDIQTQTQKCKCSCDCGGGTTGGCCNAAATNSVTNIYHMNYCCQNSPFTTSSPATLFSSAQFTTPAHSPPPPSMDTVDSNHRGCVAAQSVPNSPFCDSEGETFILPTQTPLQTPTQGQSGHYDEDSGARHRQVSYPHCSSSHTHPCKHLKHAHSSAEINDRRTKNRTRLSDPHLPFYNIGDERMNRVIGSLDVEKKGLKKEDDREVEEVGPSREGVIDIRDGDTAESQEQGSREIARPRVDVMYEFGCHLFDTQPYNLVQWLYNSKSREAIILVMASFFLYNGLRAIVQTMCEDGGLHSVFTNRDATMVEVTRRLVILSLRMLAIVISPLCMCVHISAIAAKPRVPKTSFTEEQAIERMMCVHRHFSPHYEVKFLQTQRPSVFQMSETMTKRHINSIWMSVANSLLFVALLSYLGGTQFCSRRIIANSGVCQFLTISIARLPLLNVKIHLLVVLDSLLSLGVVLCIFTLKDYYYYENRIAIFSVTVGGEAEKLYREIRCRWVLLDCYCFLTAGGLLGMSLTLASVKKTIIPDPLSPLRPEDLLNWCFWISVLSVVSFLGKSSNRLVKKTSLLAYILAALLINVVNLRIDTIPPDTINVFLLIWLSNLVLNLLLSLCCCHYYHCQRTRSRTSLVFFLLSLSLLVLLPLAVVGTVYREVVHLAAFVQW